MTCRINLYWTKSIKKLGLGTCIGPKGGEANAEAYVLLRSKACRHLLELKTSLELCG